MVHAYVINWLHIIWGTKNRVRIIDKNLQSLLKKHLQEQGTTKAIHMDSVNVQPEHVHLLVNLRSDQQLADVIQSLKGESSHWINHNDMNKGQFHWQRGYGAFSVSASKLSHVREYIAHQTAHHKRVSFQEEFESWLEEYGITTT